jgi:mannose-6-phosphate isomerase-like protein (cupin superfamily)
LRDRSGMTIFNTMSLPEDYEIAPDGSEIRPLLRLCRGSLAHCTLPKGCTSYAISHKTIEELWYCLQGQGQIWRRKGETEAVVDVGPGMSLTIPTGTRFQFRNTGGGPLSFVIATMPPWPGDDEAVRVQGKWEPKIDADE